MNFISTRAHNICATLTAAICSGLASDGGLFVPEYLPKIDLKFFEHELTFAQFSQKLLQCFFANDVLATKLAAITEKAFTFPIPLKQINSNTFVLELFHGPTSSFKDIGARFLAECLTNIQQKNKTTIMVATSGDTGSAVASAFYNKANINVIILYPKGQISARQQQQITCWDRNILALAVNGTFDHCQQLVKAAFQDAWWQQNMHLNSANSINIGRLLPQIIYYAYSSLKFYHHHQIPGYIIPTGNLGNAVACYWAKAMGFPIREIVLATNANIAIADYLLTGVYQPRASIATLANAMDVGNPSNFERLRYLFNNFAAFKNEVKAISAKDNDIKNTIIDIYKKYKLIICPHTATAFFASQQLSAQPWIMVATADPSKFNYSIENILEVQIPIPPQLQTMLAKRASILEVGRTLQEIKEVVEQRNY